MQDIGKFYERVKHGYIYTKWFTQEISLSDDSFRTAVRNAYDDIIMLIPSLNGCGNQDEDWYLAERLKQNRPKCTSVANRSQSELANFIYQIR